MKTKTVVTGALLAGVVAFLAWRMLRPLEIFSISPRFEYPLTTTRLPPSLHDLSAQSCGACHTAVYHEWTTTIHSQAWTDPYFQADWRHEGKKQICLNCHTPLDRQQKFRVLGFHGGDRWKPILSPNPAFDPALRQQGVTCAACHVRNGVVYGPYAKLDAPHPIARWNNDNEACIRCHVVNNKHWDVFFRLPPCGTVAEIQRSRKRLQLNHQDIETLLHIAPPAMPAGPKYSYKVQPGGSVVSLIPRNDGYGDDIPVRDVAALNCVQCHMPPVERPLVPGGKPLAGRRHLWRGGHDPRMVKKALTITFVKTPTSVPDQERYTLTITNTGAEHYIPTGVPDRHLTVTLRVRSAGGKILKTQTFTLERTVLWRPFIIDLWDTRLRPWQPRRYSLRFSTLLKPRPAVVEAVVRYWLMDEAHRARIHYPGPISYVVFREHIPLHGAVASETP